MFDAFAPQLGVPPNPKKRSAPGAPERGALKGRATGEEKREPGVGICLNSPEKREKRSSQHGHATKFDFDFGCVHTIINRTA